MTNADVIREKWAEQCNLQIIKRFSDEMVAAIIQREDIGCHGKNRWCILCDNADSCRLKRDEILEYLKKDA